jgi:hypothetical protein
VIARLRRSGWLLCLAALMGSALLAGCEVALEHWPAAIACGVPMVGIAATLAVKLTQ